MEKTDLKKVLSIAGQPGLWLYLAQAKNGVIVESYVTKSRTQFGANSRITTLEDVSIYTNTGEISLKQVFLNMKGILGDKEVMSSKSDEKAIKAFFAEAIPDYDQDRFYVSHMKKVLDWYKVLQQYAVIDFVEDEDINDNEQVTEEVEEAPKKTIAKKATKAKVATGAKPAAKDTTKAAASAPKKSTRSAHIKAS